MSCILFRISALSMKENYIARDYNILHTYTVPHTPTAAALEVLALSAQISLRCDFKCVFFFLLPFSDHRQLKMEMANWAPGVLTEPFKSQSQQHVPISSHMWKGQGVYVVPARGAANGKQRQEQEAKRFVGFFRRFVSRVFFFLNLLFSC